jgi:hypothetical protein
VDHRCAAEHRAPPQGDGRAAGDGIVAAFAWLGVDVGTEAGSERQRVALIGSLVAEPRTGGLAAVDVGRSVRHPRTGDVVR